MLNIELTYARENPWRLVLVARDFIRSEENTPKPTNKVDTIIL